MSTKRLLSFAEAQKAIGMNGPRGRRLKRMVLEREGETGQTIAVRSRGDDRTNYRVTLGALRHHFPELFPSKVEDLKVNMRAVLEAIDEKLEEQVARAIDQQVEPRLEELWERDEITARSLSELAKRVSRLAGGTRSPPKPTEARKGHNE